MKPKKIKSALFLFLKSINERECVTIDDLLNLTNYASYSTLAAGIIYTLCHKKISDKDYRWINIRNQEIDVFYGGAVVKDRVVGYGHLIIGLRNHPGSHKNELVIQVHRRPFSKKRKRKFWRIPEEELLRLALAH